MIGISLICVAIVFVFFRFTRLGLQMRASAVGPATSRLLGIRVAVMLEHRLGAGGDAERGLGDDGREPARRSIRTSC